MTSLSIFLLLSTCFAIIITYDSGINHVKDKYQGGSSRINEKNEKLQFQSQRTKLESIEGERYFNIRRYFLSQVIIFSIGILAPTEDSNRVLATIMSGQEEKKPFKLGEKLGKDTSLKRFQEERKTLQTILVDYNNISKGES